MRTYELPLLQRALVYIFLMVSGSSMIFCSTKMGEANDISKRDLSALRCLWHEAAVVCGMNPLCFCGLMTILCGATSLSVRITIAAFCFRVHETTECYDEFEHMPFWKFSLLGLPPGLLVFCTPFFVLILLRCFFELFIRPCLQTPDNNTYLTIARHRGP